MTKVKTRVFGKKPAASDSRIMNPMNSALSAYQDLSSRGTTMQTIRPPEATWLDLRKPEKFQEFFQGLIEHVKKNLQQVKVGWPPEYYTCDQYHERRNPRWKPFENLWAYCKKTGPDFHEAKDMIDEQIGRKLICECQILNDEKAIRRNELESIFGVDFGEAGKRKVDVV
jgi:hypothetical protein